MLVLGLVVVRVDTARPVSSVCQGNIVVRREKPSPPLRWL
jgi:hypothetical protein